jgi:hypothetical protein
VFRSNGSDVGMCSGATADNAAKLKGNQYEGALKVDASCDRIGTKDATPATNVTGAGPSGL